MVKTWSGLLRIFLFSLGSFFSGMLSAQVQNPNPHNGRWSFQVDGPKGAHLGHFEVNEGEGSWQVLLHSLHNPCLGALIPLSVVRANPEQLIFLLQGASVLVGCPNGKVTLNVVDEQHLSGHMGGEDGVTVTAVRE